MTFNIRHCIFFIKAFVNGFAQVFLQKNILTGFLFIAGIFIGNWRGGVAAVVASLVGLITARVFRFPSQNILEGLYTFSPILFSIAFINSFSDSWLAWGLLILGSVLATLLQQYFIVKKIPAFTFPFIVVTWLFLTTSNFIPYLQPLKNPPLAPPLLLEIFSGVRAFGEVLFQGYLMSGTLILIGVFMSNPAATLYGLGAAYLGAGLGHLFGMPVNEINQGLFGFSAVLTAIVFSAEKKNKPLWVLIGSVITIGLNIFFEKYRLFDSLGGAFTFPFVLGTWITLLTKELFARRRFKSSF